MHVSVNASLCFGVGKNWIVSACAIPEVAFGQEWGKNQEKYEVQNISLVIVSVTQLFHRREIPPTSYKTSVTFLRDAVVAAIVALILGMTRQWLRDNNPEPSTRRLGS